MNRLYSNFQVLFLGLIGLIMVGGSHFNTEKYEILENSVSDANSASIIATPETTPINDLATDYRGTHPTAAKTASTTPNISPNRNNSISIGNRTISIKSVNDTKVNAGNMVAKYGNKFLYGHNSSNVFGHLASLGTGTRFTVTLNGQTTTYEIAKSITLEHKDEVCTTSGTVECFMSSIANASFRGTSYDLALMTCAGTPLPNQNATHRLVVFANQVSA